MKITWVLSTQNPNKLVSMKRPAFCKLTGPIECTNFVYLYLTESQGWALVKTVTRSAWKWSKVVLCLAIGIPAAAFLSLLKFIIDIVISGRELIMSYMMGSPVGYNLFREVHGVLHHFGFEITGMNQK